MRHSTWWSPWWDKRIWIHNWHSLPAILSAAVYRRRCSTYHLSLILCLWGIKNSLQWNDFCQCSDCLWDAICNWWYKSLIGMCNDCCNVKGLSWFVQRLFSSIHLYRVDIIAPFRCSRNVCRKTSSFTLQCLTSRFSIESCSCTTQSWRCFSFWPKSVPLFSSSSF